MNIGLVDIPGGVYFWRFEAVGGGGFDHRGQMDNAGVRLMRWLLKEEGWELGFNVEVRGSRSEAEGT